jgi:LEA14-like dessication related protein
MVKMKFVAVVVFLFSFFLFSCSNPKELVYHDVKNFRVMEISMEPKVGLDVQFYNPNNYGMTLKDADIDLFINNRYVGKAVLDHKYEVPGLDTFLLPVTMKADLKNILPNALSLAMNKEVTVKLQGKVKAGKGVFVNIPINYEGKQKLNIF